MAIRILEKGSYGECLYDAEFKNKAEAEKMLVQLIEEEDEKETMVFIDGHQVEWKVSVSIDENKRIGVSPDVMKEELKDKIGEIDMTDEKYHKLLHLIEGVE